MLQRLYVSARARVVIVPVLTVALLASPAVAGSSARLEELVPADVDMVLMIEDLPMLRATWPDLPMVRAWNDPELRQVVGFAGERGLPDLPGWIDGSDPDHPTSRLLALFSGQAMLVLPDIAAWKGGDSGSAMGLPPGLVLLADVGGHEDEARALLAPPADGAAPESGSGLGLPAGTWQVAGDILILGASADDTAEAASWLSGRGGRPALAAGAGYAALAGRGGGDIQLIANLEPMVARLAAVLEAEAQPQADNPMGITPAAVLDALGLDVLRGAWLGLRLRPDRTEADYGVSFSEERGLVRLLALQPLGDRKLLPVPETAVDASVMALDVPAFWQALRDITAAISPVLGAGVEAQMAQLSAQLGIDLNTAIPQAFAGQFVTATFMHPPESPSATLSAEDLEDLASQIWLADLKPDHRLGEVLAALTPLLGAGGLAETTRQVAGRTLHVLTPATPAAGEASAEAPPAAPAPDAVPAGNVLAWALDDGHMVMGQGRLADFEAVLAQLDTSGEGMWRRREVREALAGLPANAAGLQYQDSASALAGVFRSLAAVGRGAGAEAPAVDADRLGEILSRYITASAGAATRNSGEFAVTFHVQHGAP